jgi:hypothetical protein
MSISRTSLGLLAAAGLAAAAPAAHAAKDQVVTAEKGATWTSAPASGLNTSFLLGETRGTCAGTDATNICDTTLVHVTATDVESAVASFRIEGYRPTSDFDIRVYESDAEGTKGAKVGTLAGDVDKDSPLGADDPRHTGPGDFETTTVPLAADEDTNDIDAYYLVVVPYFAVANDSYTGKAGIAVTPLPAALSAF